MNEANVRRSIPIRQLAMALVINTVWINVSEVFRYFAFVMPMMRSALPGVENAAPMNWGVFAIWGAWDTILVFCATGFFWLFLDRFGLGFKNAMLAGTMFWLSVFVILWLGVYNMNLATPMVLAIALTLALLEMLVAAAVVNWCLNSGGKVA